MFGVPTLGFGPGDEIWAHTPDDQVPIAHLTAAARFYALFPRQFADGRSAANAASAQSAASQAGRR